MKKLFVMLSLAISCSTMANSNQPSVYIYNETTGRVVMDKNSSVVRPIASVTKIMTAMVALDHDSDLSKSMHLKPGAKLAKGKQSRKDVLISLLVKSDNIAAESIAEDFPGGRSEFLAAMNRKAAMLGLKNTHFDDPSGLLASNVSTVEEIAAMMQVSALYPFIREVSTMEQATIIQQRGKNKHKVVLGNTNQTLLSQFKDIVVSKTGFTSRAGWNVGLAVERAEQKFIIVVLGAKTKQQRLSIVRNIINTQLDSNDTTKLAGI